MPNFEKYEKLDYWGVSLDPHFFKVYDGGSILWNFDSSHIFGKLSCTYEKCVGCGKKISSDSIFHLSKFWKKSQFWDTGVLRFRCPQWMCELRGWILWGCEEL